MMYVFWFSFLTLVYIFAGYPAFLMFYSVFGSKQINRAEIEPGVTVIIPAYNEEEVIEEKLRNFISLDYPKDKLEIILASDGSTDKTAEITKSYLKDGIRLFEFAKRRGKPAVLNEVVKEAKGEIIVFSDASAIFDRMAIKNLIRNFADARVGCVCGDYKFGFSHDNLRGKGEGLYVKYELFIKRKEAQLGTLLGLHGAIYAIRKGLYPQLKTNMINDDYVIPAKIVQAGYLSIFDKDAVAYEMTPMTVRSEFYRRMRIAAGNFQFIAQLKGLLNPLRGIIFIEFVSHKVLRTFTPILLILMFISNYFILGNFYKALFVLQAAFYLVAILGDILERGKIHIKLFYIPYYFCLSNLAVIMGFFRFLTGKYSVRWERSSV